MIALRRLAHVAALAGACAGGLAQAAERGDPVAVDKVEHEDLKPAFDHRPADAPRALVFWRASPGAPSCGLLPADPKYGLITPLLDPEDGAWPECDGIREAASFAWNGRTGYVFRVLQRDTREDVYPNDQFVFATRDEIEFIDELDGETVPEKKSVRWLAAWAKSRLMAQDAAAAGFAPSDKDAVVEPAALLQVARDAKAGRCRLAVDAVASERRFAPVLAPCRGVLATAAVPDKAGTVLLAMLEVAGQPPQGRVFVVDAAGAREDADLERALQPVFATGRLLDVKAALKRRLAGG